MNLLFFSSPFLVVKLFVSMLTGFVVSRHGSIKLRLCLLLPRETLLEVVLLSAKEASFFV